MNESTRKKITRYAPALRFRWLTRFYDPLVRWGLNDLALKGELKDQASILDGHRILDVGSGTGTLCIFLGRCFPMSRVVGIDIDGEMVKLASQRARDMGLNVEFLEMDAANLALADDSFDRVLSSLVFHHLTHDERVRTFRNVFRVLKPGGEFHFVDWTKPSSLSARVAFQLVRKFDGVERTSDSAHGTLASMLTEAGFADARSRRTQNTVFGTLGFFSAMKKDGTEPSKPDFSARLRHPRAGS